MAQGETLGELEDNMKDAYMLMTMDDVPEKHRVKELLQKLIIPVVYRLT